MILTDKVLKEYQTLGQKIAQLEERKREIYKSLNEQGSFESKGFKVSVTPYIRQYCVSVKGLIKKFGKRALGKLIEDQYCVRIVVIRKGK